VPDPKLWHPTRRPSSKIFSWNGTVQQLSQCIELYSIIAQPLYALTKGDGSKFPTPWVTGSPYDLAFYRLKAALLDPERFLWQKKRPNGCFGTAACQCANAIGEIGEEEGAACLKDRGGAIRRRTEIMPVKEPHTRIKPLASAGGHGRYMTVTPERTLSPAGK
jgi:hypothetical protein